MIVKILQKNFGVELATVTSQALKYDVFDFVSIFMQCFLSPQRPLPTQHPIDLRHTDLSTSKEIVVLSLTQNSFASKYTNTTCIKLRKRPWVREAFKMMMG